MRILIAAMLVAVSGAACAPVRPWERGTFTRRCFSADSRAEETKGRLHMLGAREGTRGAAGEAGGGCGCK